MKLKIVPLNVTHLMRFELFDGNYIDENLTNYSNAVLFKLKFSGPTFNASLCLHINHYNFHVTTTSSRKTPICCQRAINFLFVVKGFTSEAMRGIHFFRQCISQPRTNIRVGQH
jgi:hypothetical protein